jgi:hypothetical protein
MCGSKISGNCGNKSIFSTCVKYEGNISESGELESCDCHSVHDVLEDLNTTMDKVYDQVFLKNFDKKCFTVPDKNGVVENKVIVQALVNKVCELAAASTPSTNTGCSDCSDPCSENKNCCDVLIDYKYNQGEVQVSSGSYPNWAAPYTGLEFTATDSGVYKVTIDLGCVEETVNAKCLIGVGVGNNPPIVSPFAQYKVMPSYNSKTFHFIIDSVKTGDVLRPQVKFETGTVGIDGLKVIYEKVK